MRMFYTSKAGVDNCDDIVKYGIVSREVYEIITLRFMSVKYKRL